MGCRPRNPGASTGGLAARSQSARPLSPRRVSVATAREGRRRQPGPQSASDPQEPEGQAAANLVPLVDSEVSGERSGWLRSVIPGIFGGHSGPVNYRNRHALITNSTRSEHWVRVPFVPRRPPCALPEATRAPCNACVSRTLPDPKDPHGVCTQQARRDNRCLQRGSDGESTDGCRWFSPAACTRPPSRPSPVLPKKPRTAR